MYVNRKEVTILILIDGFLQYRCSTITGNTTSTVTILILIDGFLQWIISIMNIPNKMSHNPYFNRWFSAIFLKDFKEYIGNCHNPYFNRWFSAI